MKTSSWCPVIATHSWRHQSASCVQLLPCTVTLERIVPVFQRSWTLWKKKVSRCYGSSRQRLFSDLCFSGFLRTVDTDQFRLFGGDPELPLSRYKPHQVPPTRHLRRRDWPRTSPTPLYNRHITIGCFLQPPLDQNCHPEKWGITVVHNIGTHVTKVRFLENHHYLNFWRRNCFIFKF